ncbi:NADPH-dependent FMN reductase [Aureivirga sp. CE67]|uniref:NADPH-dependent FMN reductase n=1 Tax=Aureivirga sp. CE67 TaxID=1788983 RepID=UPI0018CBAB9C|nr:NAD(P)H-dependent oxidoreductase [Aureivirga sp. CE67]
MKKIAVLGGSNSKSSINKKLAVYASSFLEGIEIDILDLNDYSLPIYHFDHEEENGIPQIAKDLSAKLKTYDGFIVSLAEHNGTYTVFFKNIIDWLSRTDYNIWNKKPMLLLSTSPGERGAANVMKLGQTFFPRVGAEISGSFSFPSFHDHFKDGKIIHEDLLKALEKEIRNFENSL